MNLIYYDRITDELRVMFKTSVLATSVTAGFFKSVTKAPGSKLVESLEDGVGVFLSSFEF